MESTFLFLRNLCSLLILDLQLRLSSKLPQRRMRLCSFATFIMPRSRGLVSKKMWQLMTVEEWEVDGWEVILVSVLETGLPGIAVPPGATITSRSAVRIRTNFWRMVGALYLLREIEPMHLSVESLRPWDWSYPILQYLREWPTSTVIVDMSTLVKPQHPSIHDSGSFEKHMTSHLRGEGQWLFTAICFNLVERLWFSEFLLLLLITLEPFRPFAGVWLSLSLANGY
jgi:hypothetical protein